VREIPLKNEGTEAESVPRKFQVTFVLEEDEKCVDVNKIWETVKEGLFKGGYWGVWLDKGLVGT